MTCIAPLEATAANLGWLKGSILEKYTERDRVILGGELLNAVEFQPDGVSTTWWNAETGHWGVITPLERSRQDDADCRRVKVENYLGARKGVTTYTVCRRPGTDWMLAGIGS
ncbi:MAG TPA: hypothetical protein VLT59_00330 [Steroidobacteraceae bacterium]|nr:hypothetical protein [Steroidobacteraceae bacterium]